MLTKLLLCSVRKLQSSRSPKCTASELRRPGSLLNTDTHFPKPSRSRPALRAPHQGALHWPNSAPWLAVLWWLVCGHSQAATWLRSDRAHERLSPLDLRVLKQKGGPHSVYQSWQRQSRKDARGTEQEPSTGPGARSLCLR